MNVFDKDGVGTRAPRGMDKSWEGRRVEGLEMIGFVEADLRQKYFSDDQKNRNMKPQSINNNNLIGQHKPKTDNKAKNTQINNRSIKSSDSMKLINSVNVKKFTDDDESLKLMSKYYNKSTCCSNHSADAKDSINKKSDGSIFNRLIMHKKSKNNNDSRKCQSDVTVNKINKGSNNIINSVDLNFQCSHTSCTNNKLKDRTAFFESFPGDGGSIKANNSLFKNINSCNKDKSFNKKTYNSNIVNSSKSTQKSLTDKAKQLEAHLLQLLKQLAAEKQQSKQDKLLISKLQQQVSRSKAEDSSKDFLMMELQKEKKKRMMLEEDYKKLHNNNSVLNNSHQHVNCCCQTDVMVLKKENTRLNEVLQDLMASKGQNERAVVDLQQNSHKLQNNIESMLEDNDLLRREISSLEGFIDKCDVCKRAFNGKSIRLNNHASVSGIKQTSTLFQTTSSQGKQHLLQLSSLQDELAMLKVQNQDLKLKSEDRMKQYSSCFNDVTTQILKALVTQKNLKEECLSLRNQLDSSLIHNNNLKAFLFNNLNNNSNSFNNNNNFNLNNNANFNTSSFNCSNSINNMILSDNNGLGNTKDNINNNSIAPLLNTSNLCFYNRICYNKNSSATINNINNNNDVSTINYSNKVIDKCKGEVSSVPLDNDYNVKLLSEKPTNAFIRKDDNNNTTLLNFNDNPSNAMNNYLSNNNNNNNVNNNNYNRNNDYDSKTYNKTNIIPNLNVMPFNIINHNINLNPSHQSYSIPHSEVPLNKSQNILTNATPMIGGILANRDGGEGPADEESDFELSESSSVNEILDYLLDTQVKNSNIPFLSSHNSNNLSDIQNGNIRKVTYKNSNRTNNNNESSINTQNNKVVKSQPLYMADDSNKRSSSHKPNTAASGDVYDHDEAEEEEDGVHVQYMKGITEANIGGRSNVIDEGNVSVTSRNNNNNRDSNNINNINNICNNNHNSNNDNNRNLSINNNNNNRKMNISNNKNLEA